MKNPLSHKGYEPKIEYSAFDECFIGYVAGIEDIVCFHGKTAAELRVAFEKAVDGYLEACEHSGSTPQKPVPDTVRLDVP